MGRASKQASGVRAGKSRVTGRRAAPAVSAAGWKAWEAAQGGSFMEFIEPRSKPLKRRLVHKNATLAESRHLGVLVEEI